MLTDDERQNLLSKVYAEQEQFRSLSQPVIPFTTSDKRNVLGLIAHCLRSGASSLVVSKESFLLKDKELVDNLAPYLAKLGFSMVEYEGSLSIKADLPHTGPAKEGAEGLKFDADKPRYDLIPWEPLEQIVAVLTHGAKKYAPDNWRKVENAEQRYLRAGLGHLLAYARGEKIDDESGLPHLAHAAVNMMFLMWFEGA